MCIFFSENYKIPIYVRDVHVNTDGVWQKLRLMEQERADFALVGVRSGHKVDRRLMAIGGIVKSYKVTL